MNKRWIVLLSVLAAALWLAVFGDKTAPAGPLVSVVAPTARTSRPPIAAEPASKLPTALAPVPRASLWTDAGTATPIRDLFAARDWNPTAAPVAAVASAPAPVPPPLPFIYLGKRLESAAWEAFLGRGEQTLIVQEGAVIEGTYRVDSIAPPTMTLTYLPLLQRQTLLIGGGAD